MSKRARYRVLCLLLAGAVFGQESGSRQSSPSSAESRILISVRAKEGPIGDLSASDFELKEGGDPVPITSLGKLDAPPLRYCVLFDTSGSERAAFKSHQDTAVKVLQQVLRPVDRGWLIVFNDRLWGSHEMSGWGEIIGFIGTLYAGGGTALYDAIGQCASRMQQTSSNDGPRIALVFSDGGDNASHLSADEALRLASQADLRIYAFASAKDKDEGHGLKKIARDTGGWAYFLAKS